ncbi:Uncharacterised protein [Mycobacteroides abscessus subsp. abscessus]|nr:Uncharacterised protein [Mycobacteroides abscessus subsp. abscessus]
MVYRIQSQTLKFYVKLLLLLLWMVMTEWVK